jgi:DNA recombination protein RmuC
VCEVGQELYKRLSTMGEHVTAVGKALDKAVEAYNGTVGSLEGRVLVTARKLSALEIAEGELPTPAPVDRTTRPLVAPELRDEVA